MSIDLNFSFNELGENSYRNFPLGLVCIVSRAGIVSRQAIGSERRSKTNVLDS